MSHRSRLAGFIIDCQTGEIADAARFWSAALGLQHGETDDDEGALYVDLPGHGAHLAIMVQKVEHPSRVHLDIETDDLDAEADRLEKLGAKRIAFIKRWWVMEAPTGHRFCIVRMKHPELGPAPTVWD
ncbi:VOC family protein [Lysobacter silvisoli]|uniref:VOC family protein n=1 Tax=Lysobacter silvisoli TaxID=2293254 RepID=A0A371K006_9GAMM|nr:VOC family protein [Lysobacter silvisoli]RDZ27192.1 VOC family protein [Lysobacter silvisoli]